MIVDSLGHYRLVKDVAVRNLVTRGALPAGTIIDVMQIDGRFHKVYARELLDWCHWDLPVERVDNEDLW